MHVSRSCINVYTFSFFFLFPDNFWNQIKRDVTFYSISFVQKRANFLFHGWLISVKVDDVIHTMEALDSVSANDDDVKKAKGLVKDATNSKQVG